MKGSVHIVLLIGLLALHTLSGCQEKTAVPETEPIIEAEQMFCQTPFSFPGLIPEAQEIITLGEFHKTSSISRLKI
jgi:hypothetical protein